MKLHEYQAKQIFSSFGITVPRGQVAPNADYIKEIAEELGGKVIIKAQIHSGGRGKAGGVRIAKSPEEAQDLATIIMGLEINSFPVHKVLLEEVIQFRKEIYTGIYLDRSKGTPILIGSKFGGVDIEETAYTSPEKIIKIEIDPLMGVQEFQIRYLAVSIDLDRQYWKSLSIFLNGLWELFIKYDALIVEINPLVVTEDKRLLALDAKVEVDDNAMFRHPELNELRDLDLENQVEVEARKYGLVYIKMNGEIGCMVNGAGLAMASMDILDMFGGKPANFLDIGGGAGSEKVASALRILLEDKNVKALLINIFGGITRCDEVAQGMLTVFDELKPNLPVVVRLTGTNAKEGMKLLKKRKFETATTLVDAAKRIIELAGGK